MRREPLNKLYTIAPTGTTVNSRHASARARWVPVFLAVVATEGVLVLTALGASTAAMVLALVVLILISLVLLTAPPADSASASTEESVVEARARARALAAFEAQDRSGRARARALWTMLQAMSPAILLGLGYPMVSSQLASHDVGGVHLSSLVLSVSVAVPWLSQVAGTPVYRLVGEISYASGTSAAYRFARMWPALVVLVVPPVLLVAALVVLTTGWSTTAMAAYLVLALMNMLFVQSLVVADIAGSRGRWTIGWVAYAIVLLIAPTVWILPPLAGLISQVVLMGRALGGLAHPMSVPLRPFLADTARGLIMGGVLWSDKLFMFLVNGTDFEIVVVYLCLQPAVVAYSYYFAVTSPRINRAD